MEPTEPEVLLGAIANWLDGVHTSMPGSVESYDRATQTAAVKPAVQRAIPRSEGGWEHTDWPTIPSVKVAWLAAGGCSLQLPLKRGDAVWLLFSEVCWSQYRRTGQIAPPGDQRRFDLSYPIALPVSLVGALRSVTGPHIEVPDGQALTVGGDPVAMDFVALAGRVLDELNGLKSAVASHGHDVSTSGSATSQTGATTSITGFSYSPSSVAAQKLKTQ